MHEFRAAVPVALHALDVSITLSPLLLLFSLLDHLSFSTQQNFVIRLHAAQSSVGQIEEKLAVLRKEKEAATLRYEELAARKSKEKLVKELSLMKEAQQAELVQLREEVCLLS